MNAIKVAKKELREMVRDKRIRTALVMPIFTIFLIVQLFGFIGDAAKSAQKQKLYIVKSENPIVDALKKSGAKVQWVSSVSEAEKGIRADKIGLALQFGPPPTTAGEQQIINAYFDPKKDTSQIALAAVQQGLNTQSKAILEQTLVQNGLPKSAAEPIKIEKHEVVVGGQGASAVIVSILPYMIVLFAFTGAMSLASDLVAGEKEKNTLETLMITPLARTEIVFGKFLSLCVISLFSSTMALVGLALAGTTMAKSNEMLKGGLGLNFTSVSVTIVLLLPLVAFFCSMLIAVSSYARNSREAQTYLALINVLVLLPAVFSQVIGLTDFGTKLWINVVPILNTANNIRNALLGRVEFLPIAITVAVSAVLALIALAIAVNLFNREEVLTRV